MREKSWESVILVDKNKKAIGSLKRPDGDSTTHVIAMSDGRAFKYNGTILRSLVYEECESIAVDADQVEEILPDHRKSIEKSTTYTL